MGASDMSLGWKRVCLHVCLRTSLSCEEMREDSHASFMVEYTHGVGHKNRLHTLMWMVVGADGSARGACAREVSLPLLTGDVRPCTVCYLWQQVSAHPPPQLSCNIIIIIMSGAALGCSSSI